MSSEAIALVIAGIAQDIEKIVEVVLASDEVGINPKTKRNTLKNSNLRERVSIEVRRDGNDFVVETLFDNYVHYLNEGRKPMTGKQSPIDALRDWALVKGIPTDNSTLYLISRAIWRDGFEGRPIMATLEEELEKHYDEWSNQLMDVIMEDITKYFNE